ncbi:MAG: hypothetical protein ACK5W9_13060 [Bdellovibrionales bacterium]
MKKFSRFGLWLALALVLTAVILKFWYSQPNYFPKVLKSLGHKIIELSSFKSLEKQSDIEFLFVSAISLVVGTAITLLFKVMLDKFLSWKKY